jgi:gliding motility-associated-like protein
VKWISLGPQLLRSVVDLGKNIFLSDGDTFTFDTPIVNITGDLHIDADGSGKIIIPAGVTVNVLGNVQFHSKNSQCTSANPCIFEIVVNGTANFLHDFENDLVTLVWSGTGTVIVDHNFKNASNGCMDCGVGGCPNIQADPSNCRDDGSGCAVSDFCTQINNSCSSDITLPVIIGCPSDQTVSMTGSGCSQPVIWTSPTASDNCALASFTVSHTSGTAFPKGLTVVTYTATDAAGNTATCSFNVNVVDKTPPVITGCPANITVNANAACQAVVTWTAPSFTDNCAGGTLTASKAPNTAFNKGTTTVVYTATDAAGNSATCSFNVIVEDKSVPTFQNCPVDRVVNVNSMCAAMVPWELPTATDNCGSVTITSSHNPNDNFPIGKTEVKYTATDSQGNVSTCVFNVTVKNETSPVISNCPNDINLEGNEMQMARADWIVPTASTSCGSVTLTGSHQPGDLFPVGTTKVQYVAVDDGGNTSYCYFDVIVSPMEIDIDININKVVTPDGNGINDQWILTNIEKFPNNTVVVVDRWGGLIFTGARYNNENVVWRGTNRSGDPVPTGTYFYSVFVTFGSATIEKTGFIELIR